LSLTFYVLCKPVVPRVACFAPLSPWISYLDNQFPRRVVLDASGYVADWQTCGVVDPLTGADNGALTVVQDSLEYHSLFVGHYSLGDVSFVGLKSINNGHHLYWKRSKAFAVVASPPLGERYDPFAAAEAAGRSTEGWWRVVDAQSPTAYGGSDGGANWQNPAHVEDAVFWHDAALAIGGVGAGELQVFGPAGPFTFLLRNATFAGDGVGASGVLAAGQHCGLAPYNFGVPGSVWCVFFFFSSPGLGTKSLLLFFSS